MRNKTIYGLSIIVTLVFCLSVAPSATAASEEEEVLQVQTNFIKAVSTGDFALMSSLYWHSSKTSQFPPGSPSFLIQGWEESFEKYWKSSLGFPEGTSTVTSMTFHHPQVTMLKDDVAVINGYENLVNTDPTTNEETITQIRITRIVQKIGGKWLIVHDHGSSFPSE